MLDTDAIQSFARQRRRDLLVLGALGIIVILVVGAVVVHLVRTDQLKARTLRLPIPVETLPAKITTLRIAVGASGTVQAYTTLSMTSRVVGHVLNVPVDIGSVVKNDDLLVEIDDRLFAANLETAEANSEHANKQLERMQTLENQGYGSAADTEKARADAAAARQAVVQAQIDLGNTNIKSPTSAVVLTRTINPGEISKLDQEAMQLGAIDPILMVAQVSTDKAGVVTLGMQAEVGTDAFPGETFKGDVVKIDAKASVTTRTFGVYIRIKNPDLRLKPGVTGYARLESTHQALAVTSTAVMNPVGDTATVFVVDKDSRAHLRQIRRGIMAEGLTEVLDGLQESEMVVTVGQLELRDNDKVRANRAGNWDKQ